VAALVADCRRRHRRRSLIYELAWIRLLSLVLGSSTHSFELMLSAFILGLALGGLWIRRRIERLADPIRSLANIQVAMGLLALATVPLYGKSFDLAQLILSALSRTEAGYQAFHFASHFICLLVMLPATICAGMTLPLLTYALLQRGGGERVIGAVYGANTLGSIAGVLLAVNLLMPLFGAKGLLATDRNRHRTGPDLIVGGDQDVWPAPLRSDSLCHRPCVRPGVHR
jgi:hypothetical protein